VQAFSELFNVFVQRSPVARAKAAISVWLHVAPTIEAAMIAMWVMQDGLPDAG
jgi:hypothetical protein